MIETPEQLFERVASSSPPTTSHRSDTFASRPPFGATSTTRSPGPSPPEFATPDDVARIYRLAWELSLKGITVYRYGSKNTQVLEIGREKRSVR